MAVPPPDLRGWAAADQPGPVRNHMGQPGREWRVKAAIGRYGTGKAAPGVLRFEKSDWLFDSTHAGAIMAQQRFIFEYVRTHKRSRSANAALGSEQRADSSGALQRQRREYNVCVLGFGC